MLIDPFNKPLHKYRSGCVGLSDECSKEPQETMSDEPSPAIEERLRRLVSELREQTHLVGYFGGSSLPFTEYMEQLREYVEDAGEYGIAYESIVSSLEEVPFVLSGKAAVDLLEVGLLLGYKTDRPLDRPYDHRTIE
ncbi:MAG: hypothetical protein KatS3mg108_0996 [Isosphaeraceae bacterium]|nr:MAG: hypothetical protein KatS3mg108_0996 [Isosphaeraceae bacterium]